MHTNHTEREEKKTVRFEVQAEATAFAERFAALPVYCVYCQGGLIALAQSVVIERRWRWDASDHAYVLEVEETVDVPRCADCGQKDPAFGDSAVFSDVNELVYAR